MTVALTSCVPTGDRVGDQGWALWKEVLYCNKTREIFSGNWLGEGFPVQTRSSSTTALGMGNVPDLVKMSMWITSSLGLLGMQSGPSGHLWTLHVRQGVIRESSSGYLARFRRSAWPLWNITNKTLIGGIFFKHPADTFYKLIIFLHLWRPLCRQQDASMLDLISSLWSQTASLRVAADVASVIDSG